MTKLLKILLVIYLVASHIPALGQEDNPYKPIGRKAKALTAYKGRFVEVFDYDSVQRIGTVLFNIHTKMIVKLLPSNQTFRKFSDNSSASRWYSPDPLAYKYFSYSPYSFVANNPIRFTDPDGREIVGQTKDDAKKFQTDLNKMLQDKAFTQLRGLISIKGSTFKSIDKDAFAKATAGLNDDQKALATAIYNTINSKDEHYVEYASKDGDVSKQGSDLLNGKAKGAFTNTMAQNDGKLKGVLVAGIWGSTTVKTDNGSYSIIIEGASADDAGRDYHNSSTGQNGGNPVGEPATAGHEVLGHGRFFSVGGDDPSGQHVNAIRMENLILRVMGQGNIQRTGEDHGPHTAVSDPSALPKY